MKINEIVRKPSDHYEEFNFVYLAEMPQHLPGNNDFESQLYALRLNVENTPDRVHELADNFFKFENGNQIYFWHGDKDMHTVSIIVDTRITDAYCKVTLTSKNPEYNTPYASDIYQLIADHVGSKGVAFTSDTIMSTEAIKLWKGMVTRGKPISVYDRRTNSFEMKHVTSAEELSSYIGDSDKTRYVFVLHQSKDYQSGEHHHATIMEMKRKNYGKQFEDFVRNPWAN